MSADSPDDVLQRLRAFRSRSWEIFPVRGKVPLTRNGHKDACADLEKWVGWWREFPGCGWAAPAGERNGFDVLDADTPEAASELERRLPLGPRVRTGRGGMHFYLKHASGARNWTKRIPDCDFRGEGGYVVLPGSIHENGRPYEWVDGTEKLPLPDAPPWLLDITVSARPGALGRARYREGERNDRLFRLGCAVRAKGGDVAAEVHRANSGFCEPPLSSAEAARIVASVLQYPTGDEVAHVPPAERLFHDDGTPDRAAFVEAIMGEHSFAAFEDTEELLHFEGGFYAPNGKQFINRWTERKFTELSRAASVNFRREVVESVRVRSYLPRERFNPPGYLVLRNGLLDLRDPGHPSLMAHNPMVLLTFGLSVEFIPGSPCPGFLQFLERIQPDPRVRELLQEETGYCLVPGNRLKTSFFWVGDADTGKSTLQSVLRGILGTKNVCAVSLQSLADNRFAVAMLFGKLANLFADLPTRMVRETGTFKMLTGGTDEVPAEKKFQHPFSFVNSAKLFFSANQIPPVPSADEAFYRRWIITTFDQRVPIEEQDPELAGKLVADEGPGILNWAIDGLARLTARGRFEIPLPSVETARLWRRLSDSLSWFVEEIVIRDPEGSVPKAHFFARYTEWCEDRGVDPKSSRDVGTELPRLVPGLKGGFPKPGGKGTKSVRSWCGIRLKGDGPEAVDSPRETYAMVQTGVEPVEPVEPGTSAGPGSTNSTGSTGESRIDELAPPLHRSAIQFPAFEFREDRWEDDGGRTGGKS